MASSELVVEVKVELDIVDNRARQREALVASYVATHAMLEALPDSRSKALAIRSLEDSFARAMFAAAGVDSPFDLARR